MQIPMRKRAGRCLLMLLYVLYPSTGQVSFSCFGATLHKRKLGNGLCLLLAKGFNLKYLGVVSGH